MALVEQPYPRHPGLASRHSSHNRPDSGRHFERSGVDLDPAIHRDEPPDTRRWGDRRKAAVVTAVRRGGIKLEEVLRRYQLTEEEYRSWERNFVPPVTASDHPPRAEAKGRRSRRR
jgi:hypothetical protein